MEDRELAAELLANQDARTGALENELRWRLGEAVTQVVKSKGLSPKALATELGVSLLQVQRLLHQDIGGALHLRTLVRAADFCSLSLEVAFKYNPDVISSPGDTLKEMLEERGETHERLVEQVGSVAVAKGILLGETPITEDIALQLEKVSYVPAKFWLLRERHYRAQF